MSVDHTSLKRLISGGALSRIGVKVVPIPLLMYRSEELIR